MKRALVFVTGLLLGGLLFWPLRLAPGIDRAPISADAVSGTIWHGRLVGVRVGGQPVGDMAVRAQPSALLRGQLRLRTTPLSPGSPLPAEGVVLGPQGLAR